MHEASCCRKESFKDQHQNIPIEREIPGTQVGDGLSATVSTQDTETDKCESALNGKLKTIQMTPRKNELNDLTLFLQGYRVNMLKNLERELNGKKGVKWFVTVQVKMVKYRPYGQDEFSVPHFRSTCQRLLNLHEVTEQYQNCVEKVKNLSRDTNLKEAVGNWTR